MTVSIAQFWKKILLFWPRWTISCHIFEHVVTFYIFSLPFLFFRRAWTSTKENILQMGQLTSTAGVMSYTGSLHRPKGWKDAYEIIGSPLRRKTGMYWSSGLEGRSLNSFEKTVKLIPDQHFCYTLFNYSSKPVQWHRRINQWQAWYLGMPTKIWLWERMDKHAYTKAPCARWLVRSLHCVCVWRHTDFNE